MNSLGWSLLTGYVVYPIDVVYLWYKDHLNAPMGLKTTFHISTYAL